jgi:hypothetical protein
MHAYSHKVKVFNPHFFVQTKIMHNEDIDPSLHLPNWVAKRAISGKCRYHVDAIKPIIYLIYYNLHCPSDLPMTHQHLFYYLSHPMTLSFLSIRSLFNSLSARLSTFCLPLFFLSHLCSLCRTSQSFECALHHVPFVPLNIAAPLLSIMSHHPPSHALFPASPCQATLLHIWSICGGACYGSWEENCVAKNFSRRYHNVQARFLDAWL